MWEVGELDLDSEGIVREEACFDSGTECVESFYHLHIN
jgi:hypothetical protein